MISNASSINRMQSANANNNPKDIVILNLFAWVRKAKVRKSFDIFSFIIYS